MEIYNNLDYMSFTEIVNYNLSLAFIKYKNWFINISFYLTTFCIERSFSILDTTILTNVPNRDVKY